MLDAKKAAKMAKQTAKNKAILAAGGKLKSYSAPDGNAWIIRATLLRETETAMLFSMGTTDFQFVDVWFPSRFVSTSKPMQRKIDFEFTVPQWLLDARQTELGVEFELVRF